MKRNLLLITTAVIALISCRSGVKKQEDRMYSRHLQRHVSLDIITTPIPKEKADMNLLLINNNKAISSSRLKKITDSLYSGDLLAPLTIVSYTGEAADYGLEETADAAAKQHKQFNEFVIGELYPFIKKKTGIRKFRSVTICGFGISALSAFDIAWNNDDKIQRVGMFDPAFSGGDKMNDSTVLGEIKAFRKRPELGIWLTAPENDSSSVAFSGIMAQKKSITVKHMAAGENFAAFLMWALPK